MPLARILVLAGAAFGRLLMEAALPEFLEDSCLSQLSRKGLHRPAHIVVDHLNAHVRSPRALWLGQAHGAARNDTNANRAERNRMAPS